MYYHCPPPGSASQAAILVSVVCRPSSSAFLIFVHSSQELSPVQDTSEQGHIGFDFIVLDKESLDLKVLGLISSKVKQAFDCGEDKERIESPEPFPELVHLLLG